MIWPVVMKVTENMKRNANGSATLVRVNGTSVISMIPARPPQIRRESIIIEFMMCFIRCTSISCVAPLNYQLSGMNSQPVHSLQKGCVSMTIFTTQFISRKYVLRLYYKHYL